MTKEKKKKKTTKSPKADEPVSRGGEVGGTVLTESTANGSTANGSTENGPVKKRPAVPEHATEEPAADGATVKGQKDDDIRKDEKHRETETKDNPETEIRNPESVDDNSKAASKPANGPTAAETVSEATPHPFEALLDEYPLREPSEDPVWSVRIVKGWMYFLAFNFAWILLFLILWIFYE